MSLIARRHPERQLAARMSQLFAGISFFGSRNGIGATVAIRAPSGLSISSRVPGLACSMGTQA